jgi:adenosylhomocysteine nucleosidase
MKIALLAPTAREAAVIGAEAIVCGAATAAWDHAGRLLDELRPHALIVAGVCGGLDPSLAPGDLVLARTLMRADRPEVVPEAALLGMAREALRHSGRPFVTAPLLCVERPLASRGEKTVVWNATGAAGVDMESYAVAEAARARGIPWIALRAVVDPADASLPASIRVWSREEDETRLIARAAARPWEWLAYVRLALAWRAAASSLRAAAPLVAAALNEAGRHRAAPPTFTASVR